jgi:hypothetical protein
MWATLPEAKKEEKKENKESESKRLEAATTFVEKSASALAKQNCCVTTKIIPAQHRNSYTPPLHSQQLPLEYKTLSASLHQSETLSQETHLHQTALPPTKPPTMNDPGLNTLLKWSIENSAVSAETAEPTQPRTQLNPELLAQLMGGPSDADRMISSMQAIHDPSVDHENKGIAWDNFEQLVENLDNANNMEALKLWTPLCDMLESAEKQDREMACWCLGTAVQNNIKCQERVSLLSTLLDLQEARMLTVERVGAGCWINSQSRKALLRRRCRCAQKGHSCHQLRDQKLPTCLG